MSRAERLWLKAMALGAATGCHQRADRSFFAGGYQLPVCARCLGVGLGQLAALVAALGRLAGAIPARPTKGRRARRLLLLLPAAVDGGSQAMGLRRSNNRLRFITGLAAGYGWLRFLLGP